MAGRHRRVESLVDDVGDATTESPLVSVVTPVYNGAKYIEECIESVLRQTYRHFEFIIVDNCSSDETPGIVRRYAAADPRIRVFTPPDFVGVDENANRAVREISPASKYVKFVHGDDWIYPDCLAEMVAVAERHPSVAVVGAYRLEEDRVSLNSLPASLSVVSGREVCRSSLLGRPWGYLFGSPTSTLLRADLVRARDELYPSGNELQSDWEVCYQFLEHHDFGFVHRVLTFTRRHNEAESSRFWRAGAERPGQVLLLLKYGPRYLTQTEYERRLAARMALYAAFLIRRVPDLRRRDFRELQLEQFARIRAGLRLGEVVRGAVRSLVRIVSR
jgi:glycosyltransferase involved in cell wall biosynthesis